MYDRAARAQFIDTYVPINFGELYRIGAAQKQAVDEAAEKFGSQLQKWGEFKSLSSVDTQNYYNLTTERKDIQDAINKMSYNPDWIKDAANRANLQSLLNSVDYASLSKLKQNAQNFEKRAAIIAQMKAQGKYKESWDKINMATWDTLNPEQGMMNELAPLEYMTANALSNAYFDNLKPSSLGTLFKGGVKYQREGITYDMLKGIADARFNDLISTPQGMEYYREALEAAGGDEAKAKEAFTGMIADSQMDRMVVHDEIDPYWLKMQMSKPALTPDVVEQKPTRLDFLNATVGESAAKKLNVKQNNYRDYIASLIDKYPNTKIAENAKKGLANIDRMQKERDEYEDLATKYAMNYKLTGDEDSKIKSILYNSAAENIKNRQLNMSTGYMAREEFKRVAGFDAVGLKGNQNFSHKAYNEGVKAALDLIKGEAGITDNDPLIVANGGTPYIITNQDGTKQNAFQFNSSKGFVLPETLFTAVANQSPGGKVRPVEVEPRETIRGSSWFRSDKPFRLKEFIESGQFNNVQFIKDNGIIKIGDNFAVTGKLRISSAQMDEKISKGIGTATLVGMQSRISAIEKMFNGRKITEIITQGSDAKESDFYEIDVARILPADDISSEYWQRVNQEWQGGKTGIGGSSQAKEEYMTSAKQTLG